MAKVITISLPEYTVEKKPDYAALGRYIDQAIEENFEGELAIRSLSLTEHPQLSLDQFARIILEIGTDRYDPNRLMLDPHVFGPYRPDMHAGRCTVKDGHIVVAPGEMSEGADIIYNFYENAALDRGFPLRIDLLLIYDLQQLIQATRDDDGTPGVGHLERFLFRFKNPDRKKEALLGIIKILR